MRINKKKKEDERRGERRDKLGMKTWIDTQRYEKLWHYNSTTGSLCNSESRMLWNTYLYCFSPLFPLFTLLIPNPLILYLILFIWLFTNNWRPARRHRCHWDTGNGTEGGWRTLHREEHAFHQMLPVTKNVSFSPPPPSPPPFSPSLLSHPNPPLLYIYWTLIFDLLIFYCWSWVDLASYGQDLRVT